MQQLQTESDCLDGFNDAFAAWNGATSPQIATPSCWVSRFHATTSRNCPLLIDQKGNVNPAWSGAKSVSLWLYLSKWQSEPHEWTLLSCKVTRQVFPGARAVTGSGWSCLPRWVEQTLHEKENARNSSNMVFGFDFPLRPICFLWGWVAGSASVSPTAVLLTNSSGSGLCRLPSNSSTETAATVWQNRMREPQTRLFVRSVPVVLTSRMWRQQPSSPPSKVTSTPSFELRRVAFNRLHTYMHGVAATVFGCVGYPS